MAVKAKALMYAAMIEPKKKPVAMTVSASLANPRATVIKAFALYQICTK
jgi:hypothetical protein